MAIQDADNTSSGAPPASPAAPATAMGAALGTAFAKTPAMAGPTGAAAPAATPAPVSSSTPGSGRAQNMNQAPNTGPSFSFRTLSGGNRAMMSRSPASEVLNKLKLALEEMYKKNADQTFEYTLIPIDMSQNNDLNVSVLILAARDRQAPDLGVAFHTLILEGSIEPPAPKFETIGGKNVEIMRTTSDAFDDTMIRVVADAVSKQWPQANLFNAEAEVVPRDFKVDDEMLLWTLAANAALAVSQELMTRNPSFQDINLNNAQNDSNLVVRSTFNNSQTMDAVGMPLRTDIKIDFSAVPVNQPQGQGQQLERQTPISTVGGFMDIVWDAPVQPSGFGPAGAAGWGQQQAPNFQRYAARFVVTLLDNKQSLTPGAQLLAMLPALSLRENNAWVQAFKPVPLQHGQDNDIHDIGAIGYEVNFEGNATGYGSKIETKSASFTDERLYKLVSNTFKPGMLLSLDVPECGTSTWFNSLFAAAAEGHAAANAAIYDAAMMLTNGTFQKYFPSNGQIAIDENNRIHLGYYTGSDGTKHDIRDVGYLEVLNLMGERDPVVVKDFSDTYLKTNYDLKLRLSERKRIITGLFTDAVFTGYARRVTFTKEFTDGLAMGCRDAGLTMRAATSFQDLSQFERASGNHLNNFIMGAEPSGMFNRGGFGLGNPGGASMNRFGGRWGA